MKQNWKKTAAVLSLCAVLAIGLILGAVAESRPFPDVPVTHWAASSIEESVAVGLIQGHSNGTFGMGQEMSRAAFVTALGRLFQWEKVTPQFSSFGDVPRDAWYYSAVETACANKALTRQSAEFRPTEAVTREEMAVMLVRALGYDTLSGLAQDLPDSFKDLTTNTGYIAVARDLGLMTGMTTKVFAPEDPATREQAAVVLVRLYHKLSQDYPKVSAVCDQDGLGTERMLDTVAVAATRLTATGAAPQLGLPISRQEAATLRQDAVDRGAKALLLVSGDATSLGANAQEAARLVADEVKNGGWDGVQLDIARLSTGEKDAFTAFVTALRIALGDKLLFVTAEAPAWKGTSYGGYDFAALAAQADRLILRVAAATDLGESLPIASPEPLEEVYYALGTVRKLVDPDKLSLLLTTTGARWVGTGETAREDSVLTAEEIESLRAKESSHYYNRYEAAYLVRDGLFRQTAWYLDQTAVSARLRMASFLDVDHVTLSDGASVADYEGYSIVSVLWAPAPESGT